MSDDIRFERNAQAWLEMGPTQAPQRVVQAALATVETTSQQRDLRAPWRFPSLKLSPRLATAAVVAIVVIATGFLLLRNQPAIVGGPSPSPNPTTLQTTAASPDVTYPGAALQTKWLPVGGNRPAPGEGHGLLDAMVISGTNVRLPVWYADVDSSWSLIDPSTLEISLDSPQTVLANDRWQCTTGDTGTYSFRFSGEGQTLTLTTLQDECAIRAEILGGDWSRWPCPNPASRCDPELTPGLHSATFEGDPPGSFSPLLAGYSYSVPTGWSANGTYLMRRNDPGPMQITVALDVAAASQDPTCPDEIDAAGGSSAAALASWLGTIPGLVTSQPVAINIGGHDGLLIDASVVPGWVTQCPYTRDFTSDSMPRDRFVLTLKQGLGRTASAAGRLLLIDDAHARYILLDAGSGHNILIEVLAPDRASWDDLVAAAMPVIDSFQFNAAAN